MAKFEIGEVAIFDPNLMPGTRIDGGAGNGSECKIKSERFFKESVHTGAGYFYICEFPGDPCPDESSGYWHVREDSLRKKQPPQELGSWDAEIFKKLKWSPTKETENEH